MDISDLKGYKHMCFSYGVCFGWLFPELNYVCMDNGFRVRGVVYKYTDITGTLCSSTHFTMEIAHKCCLCLPIAENAQFKFVEKERKRDTAN